jgi:hypothetical protein
LVDNTPELECGLKEKFENDHLDKPTSTNSSFRGGKKTKDQSDKPLGEKWDEDNLE